MGKNKTIFGIIVFFCCVIVGSSAIGSENKKSFEDLLDDQIAWQGHYYDSDIDVATDATLEFIEKLKSYRESGVTGYNYDLGISFSYIRLYLIEMEKGSPDSASQYIKLLLQDRDEKLEPQEIEEAIEFVKELDCKNAVNWMNCSGVGNKFK